MKRIRILILIILAVVAVSSPAVISRPPASAAGITLNSSVQVSFPQAIVFKITAQSDVPITQIRLHYIVDRQNYAGVVSEGWAQFNPSPSVNTQWVWDMRRGGLPPGTKVEYWWTAADAAGKQSQTNRAAAVFDDNRFQWQSITTGPVTLLWYNGNRAFADSLMNAAREGLQRVARDTGAAPQGNVRIYIYASARDLQSAMLFPQEWEGGVTFSGFNVIAIGVTQNQLEWGKGAIAHELTHWVVGQLTFNNYNADLPTWLSEGLATYGEGAVSPDYQSALVYAISTNKLISVRSLSSPFSAIAEQAFISYGESNSIVTFLIQKYGRDKMVQLLGVFRRGSDYDEALKQVYGFDQDGLEVLWRQSLGIRTSLAPQPQLAVAVG